MRALAVSTGISKTEVSASLNRSIEAGLAKLDRRSQLPTANSKALLSFIVSGLRYVFPVKPSAIERGLITGFEAPGLEGLLSSVAEHHYIWPDAHLYQSMALVDAIRLGAPREVAIAKQALSEHLRP